MLFIILGVGFNPIISRKFNGTILSKLMIFFSLFISTSHGYIKPLLSECFKQNSHSVPKRLWCASNEPYFLIQ